MLILPKNTQSPRFSQNALNRKFLPHILGPKNYCLLKDFQFIKDPNYTQLHGSQSTFATIFIKYDIKLRLDHDGLGGTFYYLN